MATECCTAENYRAQPWTGLKYSNSLSEETNGHQAIGWQRVVPCRRMGDASPDLMTVCKLDQAYDGPCRRQLAHNVLSCTSPAHSTIHPSGHALAAQHATSARACTYDSAKLESIFPSEYVSWERPLHEKRCVGDFPCHVLFGFDDYSDSSPVFTRT